MNKQSLLKAVCLLGGCTGTIFSIAILFRAMHWPGGIVLFGVVSPVLLVIFSLCALCYVKKFSMFKSSLYVSEILAALAICVGGIAIFFKAMHFPGGSYILMLSLLSMAVACFVGGIGAYKSVK